MASENIAIDQNGRWGFAGVTNDSNQFILNARINPSTNRLLVEGVVTSSGVSIGSTITGGTQGSVLFLGAGSTLAQDNANFFWDDLNIRLGLGVQTPTATLHVVGGFRYVDGNQSNGFVLTSDANGNATWQTAGGGGIIIGTTSISGGTTGRVLYDNGGNVGELTTTGSESVVLATSPTLVTPILGAATATSINKMAITAPATSSTLAVADGKTFTASNTIILAAGSDGQTFTFPSSSGTITVLGNTATGSGSIVLATSPTLITPTLGVASATTINKVTITAPATGSTVTVSDGKTLTASNSITLAGTDSTTMTFPSTSATIARTDSAQTFTGTQTFSQTILTANAITATSNAATIPVTSGRNIVTNNSAATLTITLTTSGAVNMQTCIVQVLDFSGVAETITWVNTENSTVTVPTTSNGSTTLPLSVGFIFNSQTSKWRCIASA